jgi:hypothetical protein
MTLLQLSWTLLVAYLILAAVIIQFAAQIVYYHFFHPLAKFPGPFWGGVTRIWIALHFYWGTELETELELHKKYGIDSPSMSHDIMRLILNSRTRHPSDTNNALSQRLKKITRDVSSPGRQIRLLYFPKFWPGRQHLDYKRSQGTH